MIALIIVIFCGGLICHTYLIFPLILNILSRGKVQNKDCYTLEAELPKISIVLAVFNEEKVIEEKIISTFNSGYPIEKIEFLIGSDACTDGTESIIRKYIETYPQIVLEVFKGRTGKAGICESLIGRAKNHIIVMTDANVFLKKDCLFELIKHFKSESIGLVGANILNERIKEDGISFQEKTYLSRENKIKYQEGIIWGGMIGAFGGLYALRKSLYSPVPRNFIVDDFYLTMWVISKKYKAINELNALCDEDVSNLAKSEFKRKTRISVGNFQNLSVFYPLLLAFNGISFAFFSHKVLRWFTPILLILSFVFSIIASIDFPIFFWIFFAQFIALLFPILDWILGKVNIHIKGLRFFAHFYLMNLALLVGLFQFLKGVKSNIWKPTERFQ